MAKAARAKRADTSATRQRTELASPPTWIKPQLAKLVEQAPDGLDWLHEMKLDGYRMHARLAAARVQILTRRGNDWTDKYPAIAMSIGELPAQNAYLDGELCGVLPDGRTAFNLIQNATDTGQGSLVSFLFDLLFLDGENLTALPLAERAIEGVKSSGRVRAPSQPICRFSNQRPLSWLSISRPPRRSASPYRHRSSPAPTRSSSERPCGKRNGDRLGRRPQPAMLLISPVTVLAKATHHGGAAIRSSRAFTRRRSSEAIGNVAAAGIAWLLAAGAYAQTDEIQVYDATINAPGQFSIELHNNYTPIGRKQPDFVGGIAPNHTLNGVPEWAYGVTDWLELGLYLPLYSWTGTRHFLIDGAKLRAEFVVPHAQERSFFYGINFELSFNQRSLRSRGGGTGGARSGPRKEAAAMGGHAPCRRFGSLDRTTTRAS